MHPFLVKVGTIQSKPTNFSEFCELLDWIRSNFCKQKKLDWLSVLSALETNPIYFFNLFCNARCFHSIGSHNIKERGGTLELWTKNKKTRVSY